MSLQWHGYSERGLVNAVVEAAVERPDGAMLLHQLLGHAWRLPWQRPDGSIAPGGPHALWPPDAEIDSAEVFVEHSLSDFGEPDIIVLMTARIASGELVTKAYFIEAKRETFARNARMQGVHLQENASSIVHELFLKARFAQILGECPERLVKTANHPGVRIYADDKKRYRHIGREPMVRALVDKLRPLPAFYVALTTTPPPPPETRPTLECWPDGLGMAQALSAIEDANPLAAPSATPQAAGQGDLVHTAGWLESTYHLSWTDVEAWAQQAGLERVTRTLEENRTKLIGGN